MSPEESLAQLNCHLCGVGSKKPVAIVSADGLVDAWACKPCLRRYRRTLKVYPK